MQLEFESISELGESGSKFEKLFNSYWPAYSLWLDNDVSDDVPDLGTSQKALKKYMPELFPIYEKLCKQVNADSRAARFLTGFQPPAHITACSQAVLVNNDIQLVRNYDYHPDLVEGVLLLSSWNGKKVMATSDCLIGALDGMNEDGLAVSLTYGGRKVVGDGFGIQIIIRYVLEFCSTVKEAVQALVRVPSHMSYNVTVVDKSGRYKTVLLSPDRAAIVTDAAFTTNHQLEVDWFENAKFNNTLQRSLFLQNLLKKEGLNGQMLTDAFQKEPIYNTRFSQGFGTLYTAVYKPTEGSVEILWTDTSMLQSFNDFKEESKLIKFSESAISITRDSDNVNRLTESLEYVQKENDSKKYNHKKPPNLSPF